VCVCVHACVRACASVQPVANRFSRRVKGLCGSNPDFSMQMSATEKADGSTMPKCASSTCARAECKFTLCSGHGQGGRCSQNRVQKQVKEQLLS